MSFFLEFNSSSLITYGTIITQDQFYLNLVGQNESVTNVARGNNFDEIHARTKATTMRGPGGVDAEKTLKYPRAKIL